MKLRNLNQMQITTHGSFTINESSSTQKVHFVVEDLAGNITDTDEQSFSSAYAFEREITVSTNFFVRWFANKPLFIGSIVGVTAIVIGTWFGISKSRKKDKQFNTLKDGRN